MVLSAAQIKTILDGIAYPISIRNFDYYLGEVPERRKFPSVEIENIEPEKKIEDVQITETQQRFVIHVFLRIKAAPTDELVTLKSIEDLIRAELDGATLAGSKLFAEEKGWNRITNKKPVRNIESQLTVFVNEKASTTGSGILGANQTFTISTISNVPLLSEDGDEGINTERVPEDTLTTTPVPLDNFGRKFVEFEYTESRRSTLKTLIDNKAQVSATLTDDVGSRVMTVLPARQRHSVRRDGKTKTIIFEFEIVSG